MGLTVEELIKEKEESASVAFQSFVLLSSSNPKSLFCFFENKDAPYYHLRIKSNYSGKYHYICCGNKKKVIKTFELINKHKEYSSYKLAFFIDRDFDKSIKNKYSKIYETPCYSIENLYCSVDSFKEFIKTDLQIDEDNCNFKIIMDLYLRLSNEFLQASVLFNAWYKLQKIKSEKLSIPNNVCISNTLIPNYIELTLTTINTQYELNKIIANYPNAISVNQNELDKVISEFNGLDLRLCLRGKFIFNFMISFIRKLIEDSSDPSKKVILKKKIKFNMDSSLALNILTCYAETPDCLVDFIRKYK